MKLPLLDLKRICKINTNKKHLFNLVRKKALTNRLLIPINNISSILTENKPKGINLSNNQPISQKYANINSYKSKLMDFTKSKNEILNSAINPGEISKNHLSLSNFKQMSRINSLDMDSTEEDSSKYNNYEKYIRKTLNSFKIKKEISSFLYSSPDKQKRLLNFLTHKLSPRDNNNTNNNTLKNNISTLREKRKFIKIKINEKKEQNLSQDNNDADEDKINLKEFSFVSIGNKNRNLLSGIKSKRNETKKYIECWDNNLLKNILPQKINNRYGIKFKSTSNNIKINGYLYRNKFGNSTCKKFGTNSVNVLHFNSLNRYIADSNKYQYKFQRNKKIKNKISGIYLIKARKLCRSSSMN